MRKPPKPNKTAILLLSLLAAFAVLLALYLAVLAPYFADTGNGGSSSSISTQPGEGSGITGSTLLLFPRVARTDMESLTVYHDYDAKALSYQSYAFLRDHEDRDGDGDTYDFIIRDFPAHTYDEERFSALVVGAGYASCVGKLNEWNLEEKTEAEMAEIYANYGLGEQDHPLYYTLKKTDGTAYTVYIGAKTPDGNYYARLEGRRAIYILPTSVQESVLQPLSYFVEPRLTFDADMDHGYVYIDNFSIYHDRSLLDAFFGSGGGIRDDAVFGSPYVMFTYLRAPERDLYHSASIYGMLAPTTAYTPHDNNVDAALQALPGLMGSEVLKLGLSDADFAEGGLLENVAYTLYYEMPYGISYDANEDPIVDYYIKNVLFVTRPAADGSYTVGSLSYREAEEGEDIEVFYNMIAKVDGTTLSFLEYDLVDWVESRMFKVSIDNVAGLEISSARGDYWYEIKGDGVSGQIVTEKHSGKTYFYLGRDVPFAVNKDGYCENIEQFRNLYAFLLDLQYEGAIEDDISLTEEEKKQIMADDSRCLLSFVLTMEDGREITYRFFPYSERHSMVSVSGDGMEDIAIFYTLTASVRRIADATWQLANGVYIDPNFRYQ